MECIQLSLFGKTCPEPSPLREEQTSKLSLKNSRKSKTPMYQYLNLTNGLTQERLWETVSVSPGAYSMRSISESPSETETAALYLSEGHRNAAEESTLSQILQETVPERYYLSVHAALGILRRSSNRGKELPLLLETALIQKVIEGDEFGQTEIANAREILREVWEAIGAENAKQWILGASVLVQQEEILQPVVREQKKDVGGLPCIVGCLVERTCEKDCRGYSVCRLWEADKNRSSSHRQESIQQLASEFNSIVQKLSLKEAQIPFAMYCLRTISESEETLHQTLPTASQRSFRRADDRAGSTPYTLKIRSGCERGVKEH